MSLFARRESRSGQPFPEPILSPFPGTSVYGTMATPTISTAMQTSAVWACIRLVADAVSMLPVHEYTLAGPTRKPVPDSPFLRKPSADADMPDWLYMLVVSAMLRGNAYGRITLRDSYGWPLSIELMDPDTVRVRVDRNGLVSYSIGGVDVPRADVFHFRAYRMPGSVTGLSPIQYAATTIQTDRAVADFGYGFFRDGAHPSAILTSEDDYTQDQARTLKERFVAAVQGREPAVLSGGVKYEQIQINPNESQFLETQKLNVAQIARIFGVPPEMIAGESGSSMTYANVEQRAIDFLTFSLQPWLSRIESALAQQLPGRRHVRFDTSALLRTDVKTRMEASAIGIASHQLLPDEARAMGDLPPFTEAEKKQVGLVQMTVSPIGRPSALPGSPPAGLPPTDTSNTPPTDGKP